MSKRANGEGSIYRRPDGKWIAQIDLGWAEGRRRRKYVSASTRAEAGQKLRKLIAAKESGHALASSTPTVAQWFDTYLTEVAAQKVRPSTLRRYRLDANRHVLPSLGTRKLDQLRPAHLSELYRLKLASGLSATSVRHLHAVVRRALSVACKWQVISVNVATLVDPPSAARSEINPLTAQEARLLLQTCRDDRMGPRWSVGLALGLRQGEALGLKWEDVDLVAGTLSVRRALQRQAGVGLVFTEPKTTRSRRTIPLTEALVRQLRSHRAVQLQERLTAGSLWVDSGCVFTTESGAPIDPKRDWQEFKRLLDRAGLRDVRLHDLRHTAASVLLLQGASPRVVMEILGHSQIALTMNTYSHVAPEMQTDALERAGQLLWA